MWGMKTEIKAVVIAALGLIKNRLEKQEKIPETISIKELQKITLLGTAHILRKVLSQNARFISPAMPQVWTVG